jgi:hypothetical protein
LSFHFGFQLHLKLYSSLPLIVSLTIIFGWTFDKRDKKSCN